MNSWVQLHGKDWERERKGVKQHKRKQKKRWQKETTARKCKSTDSMRESHFLPLHKGAKLGPLHERAKPLFFVYPSPSLCVRKQEHLTTTTQRINPSCKMPARHVWRFVGCVCYSRLISAWRYTGTKHGVMLWRSDNSLNCPKRRGERKNMQKEVGIEE